MRYYNTYTEEFYTEQEYKDLIKKEAILFQKDSGLEDYTLDEITQKLYEEEENFKPTWDENPIKKYIQEESYDILLSDVDKMVEDGETTDRIIYEVFSDLISYFKHDDVYYLPQCYEDEAYKYLEPIVKSYINDYNNDW